jgi:hypothetical protein
MPIQPGSIRRPLSPVAKAYVPPDGFQYKVKDNDSWVSLARGNGLTAWELIRYNYPGVPAKNQQAAPEVNWYLQEYVGCTQLTPDKRNYMFSSSASPGKIWIPNMPTADKDAKKLVLATLRGARAGIWPRSQIDRRRGRARRSRARRDQAVRKCRSGRDRHVCHARRRTRDAGRTGADRRENHRLTEMQTRTFAETNIRIERLGARQR